MSNFGQYITGSCKTCSKGENCQKSNSDEGLTLREEFISINNNEEREEKRVPGNKCNKCDCPGQLNKSLSTQQKIKCPFCDGEHVNIIGECQCGEEKKPKLKNDYSEKRRTTKCQIKCTCKVCNCPGKDRIKPEDKRPEENVPECTCTVCRCPGKEKLQKKQLTSPCVSIPKRDDEIKMSGDKNEKSCKCCRKCRCEDFNNIKKTCISTSPTPELKLIKFMCESKEAIYKNADSTCKCNEKTKEMQCQCPAKCKRSSHVYQQTSSTEMRVESDKITSLNCMENKESSKLYCPPKNIQGNLKGCDGTTNITNSLCDIFTSKKTKNEDSKNAHYQRMIKESKTAVVKSNPCGCCTCQGSNDFEHLTLKNAEFQKAKNKTELADLTDAFLKTICNRRTPEYKNNSNICVDEKSKVFCKTFKGGTEMEQPSVKKSINPIGGTECTPPHSRCYLDTNTDGNCNYPNKKRADGTVNDTVLKQTCADSASGETVNSRFSGCESAPRDEETCPKSRARKKRDKQQQKGCERTSKWNFKNRMKRKDCTAIKTEKDHTALQDKKSTNNDASKSTECTTKDFSKPKNYIETNNQQRHCDCAAIESSNQLRTYTTLDRDYKPNNWTTIKPDENYSAYKDLDKYPDQCHFSPYEERQKRVSNRAKNYLHREGLSNICKKSSLFTEVIKDRLKADSVVVPRVEPFEDLCNKPNKTQNEEIALMDKYQKRRESELSKKKCTCTECKCPYKNRMHKNKIH